MHEAASPSPPVKGEDVRLLARAAGLELSTERAELLATSVQALLSGDARLAALDLHVTSAAGSVWPEVPGE